MLNKDLLAKWWWKLLEKPTSLIKGVIREKHQSKKGTRREREKNSTNISFPWRGVMSVKDIFWAKLKFKLENEECQILEG